MARCTWRRSQASPWPPDRSPGQQSADLPPANASGGLDADLRRRLSGVRLRLAGGTKHATWQGPFEIVALTGTLSQDGGHLHLAVADQQGRTIGGHLAEGSTVRTTAEVVVAADDRLLSPVSTILPPATTS
jgi:hypothetical protein